MQALNYKNKKCCNSNSFKSAIGSLFLTKGKSISSYNTVTNIGINNKLVVKVIGRLSMSKQNSVGQKKTKSIADVLAKPNKTTEIGISKASSLKSVFTSSTCSVVNGPPYLDFPRSSREGMSSSQYVKALRLKGALCLATNLRTC